LEINIDVDTTELEDALNSISTDMANLSRDNRVRIEELFDQSFMEKFTQFSSIEQFFENSEWDIESVDDVEDIPEELLDNYVLENTKFSSWSHMMNMAGKKWTKKQLSDI